MPAFTKSLLSFAIAASLIFSLTNCSSSGTNYGTARTLIPLADRSSASLLSSATGRSIFEGLYFGEGPIATLFPEFWSSDARKAIGLPNLTPTQHGEYVAAIHRLEGDLVNQDPQVFTTLKSDLTSGDPSVTQQFTNRLQTDVLQVAKQRNINVAALASKYKRSISTVVGL